MTEENRTPTLADELAHENELLRRKVIHATRPKRPLSMQEAIALHRKVEGSPLPFARLSDINDEPEREFGAELEAVMRKHFGNFLDPIKVQAAIVDIEELRRKHGDGE